MAINGCSSGLFVTALLALLVLPAQYYVPELYSGPEESLARHHIEAPSAESFGFDFGVHLPPSDLFVTVTLLILGMFTYLCEWIQRKLMERRILKLNQYLSVSLDRLRAWDAQQEQLELTLKMVQNATSEYNLLLYLLLRQHRGLGARPHHNCYFEKDIDENYAFLRSPTIEV